MDSPWWSMNSPWTVHGTAIKRPWWFRGQSKAVRGGFMDSLGTHGGPVVPWTVREQSMMVDGQSVSSP